MSMRGRGRMTLDDGMMVWKGRDAYRVHTVLLALFYAPQVVAALLALSYLSRGFWEPATSMVLTIAALWGVRWVLCTALPWGLRWGWSQMRSGRTACSRKGH